MICHRSGKARRKGTHAVEFATMFPVLVLFMFAIFEYGNFLMKRQLLDDAAREGARVAACGPTFSYNPGTNTFSGQTLQTSDIQNLVFSYLDGQGLQNPSNQPLSAADIQVYRADPATGKPMTDSKGSDWTKCSFGETVALKIVCRYDPVLPAFGYLTNPDPVTFICLMRSEAN